MSLQIRQISFDEAQHKYTDEYLNPYISVTTKIGLFEKAYDIEYWSVFKALKESGYMVVPNIDKRQIGIRDANYKIRYYNLIEITLGLANVFFKVTPAQLKEEWERLTKESHATGNTRHSYLEDSINSMYEYKKGDYSKAKSDFIFNNKVKIVNQEQVENSDLKNKFPSIYSIIVKMINKGWTLYCETRIYHPDYYVAGTIDLLFVKGKEFVILDWKTNKHKLKFEAGYFKKVKDPISGREKITNTFIKTKDTLKNPLDNLPQCKGVVYSLQLSLYASILEDWGYTAKRLVLCHFEPIKTVFGDVVVDSEGQRKEFEPQFFTIDYTAYKPYADIIKKHKAS